MLEEEFRHDSGRYTVDILQQVYNNRFPEGMYLRAILGMPRSLYRGGLQSLFDKK